MEIKRAKTQGFCFGVAITVKKAEEAVASGAQVTTLWHGADGDGLFAMHVRDGEPNRDMAKIEVAEVLEAARRMLVPMAGTIARQRG